MTLVVLFLIFIIFGVIYSICKKQRKKDDFKKKLRNLYKNIYKKGFDVEKFILQHEDVINSTPLELEEYAIIKDKFTFKYNKDDKREFMQDSCVICYEQYDCENGGKLLIEYPDCGHTYHFDCLAQWFQKKMDCPCCKKTIRASIIRSIVYNNKGDFKKSEDIIENNMESKENVNVTLQSLDTLNIEDIK